MNPTYIPKRVKDQTRAKAKALALRKVGESSFLDVANALGVTENAVRGWGHGAIPSFPLAEKILATWGGSR